MATPTFLKKGASIVSGETDPHSRNEFQAPKANFRNTEEDDGGNGRHQVGDCKTEEARHKVEAFYLYKQIISFLYRCATKK